MANAARTIVAATVMAAAASALAHKDDIAPAEIRCTHCKEWNEPQKPFKIYGNTYYVGTSELSAMLITSPKGHILLDGALPQSATLIEKNITSLGFRMRDVKLILNSHAHFDHAGGIAALQKASGAKVAASAHGAQVLRAGTVGMDDPQYDPQFPAHIPKIASVRAVAAGETLTVGALKIQAVMTPGHTPGGTTWTWRSCEKGRCLDMVYADSLNPVSNDEFRFSGDATTPDKSAEFRESIARVAGLKCDVIVSVHPGFTEIQDKLAGRTKADNPFIDPEGCRKYAAGAAERLDARIATEKKAAPGS